MNHNYRIQWFGLLADRRGLAQEEVSSASGTPGALYREISTVHALGLSEDNVRAAVNDVFVPWEHTLGDGDFIAFLPPMSGG